MPIIFILLDANMQLNRLLEHAQDKIVSVVPKACIFIFSLILS